MPRSQFNHFKMNLQGADRTTDFEQLPIGAGQGDLVLDDIHFRVHSDKWHIGHHLYRKIFRFQRSLRISMPRASDLIYLNLGTDGRRWRISYKSPLITSTATYGEVYLKLESYLDGCWPQGTPPLKSGLVVPSLTIAMERPQINTIYVQAAEANSYAYIENIRFL